jgi:hypothetical protein
MPDDILSGLTEDLSKAKWNARKAEIVGKSVYKLTNKFIYLATKIAKAEESPIYTTPDYALQRTMKEAPKILVRHMKEATQVNKEFNNEFFMSRLRKAANSLGAITITPLESGSVKVKLNLDKVAGGLADYGAAVRKVRAEVKKYTKKLVSVGQAFSPETPQAEKIHFWEEKFYKAAREGGVALVRRKGKIQDATAKFRAKYWETMHKRMDASGKIAPFWEILDKGIAAYASKGGGRWIGGYPINMPTDFTGKAMAEIKRFYDAQLVQSNATKESFNIDKAYKEMKEVEADMEVMERQFESLKTLALDPAAELIAQVGDKIEFVDMNKLNAVAEAIRQGEQLPAGGSYIGIPGYKVRVRTKFISASIAERLRDGTL